ncbi:MAG: porin [Polaromonas sp.]|nr:porin [Polaromonas sp.]
MKKTLIAFAALSAIAGLAQAQSSVTLYGLVDVYVGRTTSEVTGIGATPEVKRNVINSSGQNNSRWGVRGTEDLGGGLKAVFGLEGGINPDVGGSFTAISNQGGALFGRQAFVGASGGFGTVSLGRQYTAYDSLRGSTNMIYDNNFATTATVWGAGLQDYQNRASSSISYASPSFAGFSGGFVYGLGEQASFTGTPAPSGKENTASVRIQYANGPLLVGFAHQQEEQFAGGNYFGSGPGVNIPAANSTFNAKRKYNLVGAAYDFGVVKLVAQYNDAKGATSATASSHDKEFQIGASVPFGPAAIAVGYSIADTQGSGIGPGNAGSNKSNGLSLLGTYALSKRTNLYAGFTAVQLERANAATEEKRTQIATGVRHLF